MKQNISYQIINVAGEVVTNMTNFETDGSNLRIDTSSFAEGMFFINFEINGQKLINRFARLKE